MRAARAVRTASAPASDAIRQAASGEAEHLTPEAAAALQRAVGNAAFSAAMAAQEQHRHGPACGHTAPASVQRSAVQDVLRTPGRPLDEPVRADMESRLGADFSDVRVHTDAAAHESATSVNAHAYTSGSHIVFQRGRYDASSAAGRHMLAHELTHVIQQRSGPVAGTDLGDGTKVSDPSDRFEREAEAHASRALSGPASHGEPAPRSAAAASPGTGHTVQRSSGPAPMDVDEEPGAAHMDMDSHMDMDVDMDVDMDTSAPATVDKAQVATLKKALLEKFRRGQPNALGDLRQYLKATLTSARRDGLRGRKLSETDWSTIRDLYYDDPQPQDSGEYTWAVADWAQVRAEVEAVYEFLSSKPGFADGGGLMVKRSDKQWLLHKPALGDAQQTGVSEELRTSRHYASPEIKPASGDATPGGVFLADGTELKKGTTYAFDSPGGTHHRVITYAKDMPEMEELVLPPSVLDLESKPARGSLERFTTATKSTGPITVDKALLEKWGGGERSGWKPDQNAAMSGTSARNAAVASGMRDGEWQWLHLLAFTFGGHDGKQPNHPDNLAAGLAAANGHHLVLENLVKKMVLDAGIPQVRLTATAHMLTNTYHVCSSLDYVLQWEKDGQSHQDTFHINALNPQKSMGGQLELLYKLYVLHHP
ncbi:DUF4157 domain-containing protein [Streptomyces chattanoogensis]|uniref:eCIS core domain-containing protein n=1 Tax=Streptomyces chattanoogensis TaxID=66876 RepID=UPI0006B505E3